MNLEEYIYLLQRAENAEDAFKVFTSALEEMGFDRVSYTLCTDHPSLDLQKQHGLSTSYPDDWMKYYIENDYLSIDPVVMELLSKNKIFKWDDVTNRCDKKSSSFKLMKEAEDAQVTEGIGISVTTPFDEITGIGIARSQRTKEKISDHVLSTVYFYTMNFHEVYRDLKLSELKNQFSDRQKEVLHWARLGKTDAEISELVGISYATVRYHWNTIFRRLDVYSRAQAIEKSVYFSLSKRLQH